jgi:hypothetical protein
MTKQTQGILIAQEAAVPEPIEVGMYKAKLVSWEEHENPQYGDYVRMEFEIVSGESEGTLRSLVASKKLTKGKTTETTSKLWKVVTGLRGSEPEKGEQVVLDDLVGTECQILIEDKAGSDGWQEISKVLPIKS